MDNDVYLRSDAGDGYNDVRLRLDGPDVGGGTTYSDAGAAVGILVGSGSDVYTVIVIYNDAGAAVGILVGSGYDRPINTDNNDDVIAGLIGSGSDIWTAVFSDAGKATGILVGNGIDGSIISDLGYAAAILLGSASEVQEIGDVGTAIGILVGSGSDTWTLVTVYNDAGAAVGVLVGSGTDTYTFPLGVPGDIYGAATYGGLFRRNPKEEISGLGTEPAKGEATPERLEVKGKKASTPEWTVAMAADRLKINYQYQVPIEYGRTMKNGQVIDFIFYIAPIPVPCYVQGDYWHGGREKRQKDQWMMTRVQAAFDYQVTAPIEIWEHEVPTVDAAVTVLRQRLHL